MISRKAAKFAKSCRIRRRELADTFARLSLLIYNLERGYSSRTHAEAEISFAFERLSTAARLGCDTETSGFNSRVGKLFSIQFSDGEFNVLVPLSEGVELGRLADILADSSITKIFHNAKFDLEFLTDRSVEVNNIFDTMIAEKVLTRGAGQSASLAETLVPLFCCRSRQVAAG